MRRPHRGRKEEPGRTHPYNIVLAPGKTPQPVVDKLSDAIGKVMADRTFIEVLVRLGVDPISDSSPQRATTMLRAELAKWQPIIQALGLGAEGAHPFGFPAAVIAARSRAPRPRARGSAGSPPRRGVHPIDLRV